MYQLSSEKLRKTLGKASENIGKSFGKHSENIRKTFGKHWEKLRKTFGKHSENIGESFGKHSGNIQGLTKPDELARYFEFGSDGVLRTTTLDIGGNWYFHGKFRTPWVIVIRR